MYNPIISQTSELPIDNEEENYPTETKTMDDDDIRIWPEEKHTTSKGTISRIIDMQMKGILTNRNNIVVDEEERQTTTTSSELLPLHYRYGHISFPTLIEMAKQGVINKKFTSCPIPTCSACLFAKATKRRWRDKPRDDYNPKSVTHPGERVSVDQLVSPTPGLVAQITGILTTKRYKYATVFVDQYSSLGYVYLQKTVTAEETILGKKAIEQYAAQRGVQIKAYHADDGIFRVNKWVHECRIQHQLLTFAGVNANHQNVHAV